MKRTEVQIYKNKILNVVGGAKVVFVSQLVDFELIASLQYMCILQENRNNLCTIQDTT